VNRKEGALLGPSRGELAQRCAVHAALPAERQGRQGTMLHCLYALGSLPAESPHATVQATPCFCGWLFAE
jgi:hypothetical protein